MRNGFRIAMVIAAMISLSAWNAHAKKPEITRLDAQYLDKTVKISVYWQSTEMVSKVKVAAGKEAKDVNIDPYANKRNPQGYSGQEDIVLQAEPGASQESIFYSIQLEDEDGQRSSLVTGRVRITETAAKAADDQWGKEKLSGTTGTSTTSSASTTDDLIDKLRQVAKTVAAPPFLQEVTVNNSGSNTVTFKTKTTHSVALKEINIRVFDSSNKQVDSQQISATGTIWEGTSKDFTLSQGSYSVIVQATDESGNTSQERKANFTITGTGTTQ